MPRYTKIRHNRYWFQISIPARHRAHFGKATIQENLRTSDVRTAATAALERAAHWKRQFDLLSSPPETISEVYKITLEETRQRINWIKQNFKDREDREFQFDLLEDQVLNPELRRLGLIDRSELDDELLLDEAKAAFDAVRAAKRGQFTVPAEYREPFNSTVTRFIEHRQSDPIDRLAEQTIGQMKTVYRLFCDHIEDAPLATITRAQATEFMDKVRLLNRNWGRSSATKSLTLKQLLESSSSTGAPTLSSRTLNRYISSLNQVWEWAKERDEVSGENPFPSQGRRSQPRRNDAANAPWPEKAIRAYFEVHTNPGTKGDPDPHHWLPRIALLSGMRLDEICSLECDDIKKADGVLYFDITDGKTDSSVRVVPVHSDLKGFLELIPKSGFIFPKLTPGGPDRKRSWNVGKRLGRRFGRIEGSSTFHAFRKNVAETFERERIPETEASQILGHKKAGMTYGVYSPNGLRIDQKRDLIELLKIPE